MKNLLTPLLLLTSLFFTHSVFAYEDSLPDEKCKKPKFHSFSLPEFHSKEKLEVPINSEFSFTTSHWLDPKTFKLKAKNKPIPFTLEDKNSFFLVTAKIPAEYTGQFVRIDVIANALLGCKGIDGWLVKVAPLPGQQAEATQSETAQAQPTQPESAPVQPATVQPQPAH